MADYSIDFDGTQDYVRRAAASHDSTLTAFTTECWVKFDAAPTSSVPLVTFLMEDHTSGYWYVSWDYISAGVIKLDFDFVTTPNSHHQLFGGANTITTGNWYHLATVWDGTNQYIYVDGEIDGQQAASGTMRTNIGTNGLTAGIANDNASWDLDGKMTEVRIWSVERTQAEIQANMNKRLNGDETGLILYWKMDDGSGTNVNDYVSGGSKDGTLTNGTWSEDFPVWAPPTSVKTVNGLAKASIKTVNSLAIASVKTINGLA